MLKQAFLIFFFSISTFAHGQNVDSISKIIFNYGISHGSWGRPGICGRGEKIELTQTQTGDFQIVKYIRTASSAGKNGKDFHVDTVRIDKSVTAEVKKSDAQYWIMQLNSSKDNFSSSYIMPFLKSPSKKEIFRIAKKYDKLWMIQGKDADKEGTKKAITDIQEFVKMDSFLVFKKPSIQFDMVVMDSYNGLIIQVITTFRDTIEYRNQFFEPLGQPTVKYHRGNYLSSTKVFNLEANTSAIKMLPLGSLTAKALDINNLTEFYIKWYLETQTF
jgi:hypothetical protein